MLTTLKALRIETMLVMEALSDGQCSLFFEVIHGIKFLYVVTSFSLM